MISKYRNPICIFGKYMQNNLPVMLGPISYPSDTPQPVRHIRKHWDPKFKKLRREKVIKVELPNFEETRKNESDLTPDEIRSRMKKLGIFPQSQWSERETYFSCTPSIFESYVAPEGDGKFSAVTKEGAKQKYEILEKKSKSYLAIREIKKFDDSFIVANFPDEAMDIYIKAHTALAEKDTDKLIQYVTETAYPRMTHNIMNKTIRWKFLQSLEPARIVHARCTPLISKENQYGQLTVRFHTQQMLCIYDRFGRLLQGSEILTKDVLEYVVFEKHIANQYGTWRIHGKIIPSWMPPSEPIEQTYIKPVKTKSSSAAPSS